MKEITYIVIGAIIGIGGGYVLFNESSVSESGEVVDEIVMEDEAMDNEVMAHDELEVDDTLPVPEVILEAVKDSKDGYNLHVITKNYTFAAEKAGKEAVANEGHAHLYVNGVKVARVYGEWFHLGADKLSDGDNEVEITLNANDHSDWTLDGAHIGDVVILKK